METVVADTNVLVRFLIIEDLEQSRKAKKLFKSSVVLLPETVFMETEWVLRSIYEVPRMEIAKSFRAILAMKHVQIDRRNILLKVIEAYEKGFDFADALHYVAAREIEMKTFDRKFVNRAKEKGWKVSLL